MAVLFVLCGALVAADTLPPATALWPLPPPQWMRDPVLGSGLVIRTVTPGLPAHLGRVAPGDAVTSVGGLAPCSMSELVCAVHLAAMRADNTGAVLRAGATVPLRLPAFMAWARWGIEVNEPTCAPPASLDAKRAAVWPSLPMRVRLVAARLAAATPEQAWLGNLVDLATAAAAVDGARAAVPQMAMPDPYLARVAAWWRLCAAGPPKPSDDADEALFRAAHLLWPTEAPAAAGTIATGDAEVDRLLQSWASGPKPMQAGLTRAADQLVGNGIAQLPGESGGYLGQCLAAIIDPDRHGGWPFRSAYIWEPAGRAQIVAGLNDWAKRDPANAGLAALGRLAPAVMDGDGPALLAALTTLQRTSPWLAQHSMIFVIFAGRMHGKQPWLITTLQAAPAELISPTLRYRLGYLAQHPTANLDQLLSSDGPSMLAQLASTWTAHAAWTRQTAAGSALSGKLNTLLWDIATSPSSVDAEACVPLAWLQLLANGDAGTPHWQSDTIAAALARGGQFADAVSWQQTAVRQLREADIPEQKRATSLAEYNARLAQLRAGHVITAGAGTPAAGQPREEALGRSTGSEVAGRRAGPWTTSAAGAVVQILGYHADEPGGRWIVRQPNGALRWSGWVSAQSRLGWWTIASADGGTASGWYDGENGGARIGWWTLRAADGSVRAEGPCAAGRPVAPWRQRNANGAMSPIDAAEVVLPAEPPLPDTKPAVPSDF